MPIPKSSKAFNIPVLSFIAFSFLPGPCADLNSRLILMVLLFFLDLVSFYSLLF